MWNLVWPIAVIVAANTCYNICMKATPSGVNAFLSLCITYLTAAGTTLVLFFLTSPGKPLLTELGKVNWVPPVLGVAIVGLELGYVEAYRAGWKVSLCSLTANITLACVLLVLGILVYRESVSLRQLAGIGVCGLGLYLISSHG